MSGITVLSSQPRLEQAMVGFYSRSMAVRRVWSDQWRDSAEMTMDVGAANPELLIIGDDVPYDVARYVVSEVDRQFRSTTTLVLADDPEVDAVLDLLRLGARDVIDIRQSQDRLKAHLDPIIDLARQRHDSDTAGGQLRRRVITVLSPKGGTGKTTLATNLGVAIAQRLPKQVLLVDLDLQFGDCATGLGLKPEHSLLHAIKSTGHERSALKVFVATHDTGLAMLPPPDDLVATDSIGPDELKKTLAALAEEFPFVIADTAAGIDPAALAAMELSTDFLFVTTTDVPSILAVRRQIEALDKIGFTNQRRTLVVNRANAKVGLSVEDVEASIGMEARFEIPSSRVITVATNEGTTVVEKDNNLARRFEAVANYFAPVADDGSNRSFLRSLRKDR